MTLPYRVKLYLTCLVSCFKMGMTLCPTDFSEEFIKITCKEPMAHAGCSVEVLKAKTVHRIDSEP